MRLVNRVNLPAWVRLLAIASLLPLFSACATTSSSSGSSCIVCDALCLLAPNVEPAPAPAPPPPPPSPTAAPAPDPCAGRIVLRGVNFAFDRAELTGGSMVILDVVAESLNQCPDVRLRVDGHTDSIGAGSYNQSLSQRRAESVRSYFVEHGVTAARLEALGHGESQPIADNGTDEGRRLNRRVELNQLD